MGFSFTATAECDKCGAMLGSSDEECDHDGFTVNNHVFRRLGEGRESLVGVEATTSWKWYKLAEKQGEDWIAYEYIGTKAHINAILDSDTWDRVEDLPNITMSANAPQDVMDHISDDGE